MRPRPCSPVRRRSLQALLVLALLAALLPRPALAADVLTPHTDSADDVPLVQQTGPGPPGPVTNQLVPTTELVEDPTRQAGGEDDAQRAYERENERRNEQNDDGGERRRK